MRRFTATGRNSEFDCDHCGRHVPPLTGGGCRNHCPYCLYSRHVDIFPGDRASPCGGMLEPVAVLNDARKGYVIVHRCQRCSEVRRNKAATADPVPDDFDRLVELSRRPLPDEQ